MCKHQGHVETRALPERGDLGEIRIRAKATPAIVAAVEAGRTGMSVEFAPLLSHRTNSGITEVRKALVYGAALTDIPAYEGSTSAQLRERDGQRPFFC